MTLLLATPPALFLAAFFFYPVIAIVGRGIAPARVVDIDAIVQILTRPFVVDVVWFTFWQAAVSTLLTLAVALPAAYAMSRLEFRGRRLLNALIIVPFVLPTVVVAAAFMALVGPRSPIGVRLDQTIWAILLAHVFFNYAVVVRVVGSVWSQLDPRLEEAARVLGANRWSAFRQVSWPLLRPAIVSAAGVVFLFTFTSFGVILILGGPEFATLEVEIYRQAAQLLDLRVAATLALLQLAALGALLAVYGFVVRRAVPVRHLATSNVARRPRTRTEKAFLLTNLAVMAALLGLPLAVLVARSLSLDGSREVYAYYAALFATPSNVASTERPFEALRNSLAFAVVATGISSSLGLLASLVITRSRGWLGHAFDAVLTLPLGTSAVIVGFGYLVTLGGLPIDLRASPVLIPIAHSVVALPFIVRAVVPVLRSIDPRLREAAAVLGATPSGIWRSVDLPIITRAVLVGAGFAFSISLGEFGATLFIVRPDTPTMPIAIFRLLDQPSAFLFGQAMAMSVVLMVVTALAVLVIDRFRLTPASAL